MNRKITITLVTIFCTSTITNPVSGFDVLHYDRVLELIDTPNIFQHKNIPTKLMIIPGLNQNRIEGQACVHFWIKNTADFNSSQPIFSMNLNKNAGKYFRFFLGNSNGRSVDRNNHRFSLFRTAAHKFRQWTQVSVELEIGYPSQNTLEVAIRDFIDGVPSNNVFESFTGNLFLEVLNLDFILGERYLFHYTISQ